MPQLKASAQKAKNVTVMIHHAPEALTLATAASVRLQKLLSLCDRHIDKLDTETDTEESASNKEAKTLIRLVLNLHKNLDHYTQILHPPVIESLPSDNNLPPTETDNPTTKIYSAKLAAKKPIEEKLAAVIDSIAELSISAEHGIDLPSKEEAVEMTTDAWEEAQIAQIEVSCQNILKDIETGKLTRRQGLEIIADMEWRFKRELQERQAADRNKKSGNRWATR